MTEPQIPDAEAKTKKMSHDESLPYDFDYVLRYCPDGTVFEKDRLVEIERKVNEEYEKWEKNKAEKGKVILTSITGDKMEVVFDQDPEKTYVWEFHNLGQLAERPYRPSERQLQRTNNPERYRKEAELGYRAHYHVMWPVAQQNANVREPEVDLRKLLARVKTWKEQWKNSEQCKQLTSHLEKNAKNMPRVERVVCFGAGSVGSYLQGNRDSKPWLDEHERSYFQHAATCTIAEVLSRAQADDENTPNKIDILAQDPRYTKSDIVVLQHMDPPINITQDKYILGFEAFKHIDSSTFVVTIGEEAPVRDMAIQLAGDDGPAGMFCNTIDRNLQKEWTGKLATKDDVIPLGHQFQTASMWDYKLKCLALDIKDEKWFGTRKIYEKMVVKEFVERTELLLRKVGGTAESLSLVQDVGSLFDGTSH